MTGNAEIITLSNFTLIFSILNDLLTLSVHVFAELIEKLGELCGSSPVTLKCQLPNGDLETLISITSDEDLANIIDEYDRASSSLDSPLKIRAILSPPKKLSSPPPSSSSSSASYSPSGSPHAYSPPSAAAYRLNRCSRVPLGYPIGVRKGCWYTRQVDGSLAGSPRFWGASLQ